MPEDISSQIAGAKQSIASAELQLQEERKKAKEARQYAQQIQVPQRSIQFQQQYIKGNRALAGRTEQTIQERQKAKQQIFSQAESSERELTKYEKEVLEPYKKEVSSVESQVAARDREIAEYELAEKLIRKGKEYVGFSNPSLRKKIAELKFQGVSDKTPREQLIEQGNISLASGQAGKLSTQIGRVDYDFTPTVEIGGLGYSVAPELQKKFVESKMPSQKPIKPIKTDIISPSKSFTSKIGGYLKKPEEYITRGISFIGEKAEKSGFEFRLPLNPSNYLVPAGSFLSKPQSRFTSAVNGENLVMNQSIKTSINNASTKASTSLTSSSIQKNNQSKYLRIVDNEIIFNPKVSRKILETGLDIGTFVTPVVSPARQTSYVGSLVGKKFQGEKLSFGEKITGGLIFGSAAAKGAKKGIDIIRTRGRTELPSTTLITKEVLSGREPFPLSKSAPTQYEQAKIHMDLFKKGEYRLPGYTKPGGFHAAQSTFWNTKNPITQKGSSEFPGLYISHSVSPYFLRLQGKSSGSFSLNMFKGFAEEYNILRKPSVAYIQPSKLKIGKSASLGEAFVPGIKTEVEAIIPPGTGLEKTAGRYYFKYKGRRVIIDELKTINGKSSDIIGKTTAERLKKYYSLPSQSSSPGRYIGSITRLKSNVSSKKSYSKYDYSKSDYNLKRDLDYKRSTKKPKQIIVGGPNDIWKGYNYKGRRDTYNKIIVPKLRRPNRYNYPRTPIIKKGKPITFFPRLRLGNKSKRSKNVFGYKTRYTPSLTASGLGITATKKPKQILGGYFVGIRPMIVKKEKKKGRKNKII